MAKTLSIIVPMLNEMAELPSLLAHLLVFREAGCEVLLVDGGSSDDSVALAEANGFAVLPAPRGRACQMNAGAAAAHNEVLLFLHADTRLPADAVQHVLAALSAGDHHWGRFDVRIAAQDWRFALIASLMNWRSRLTGIATGDQAMFVDKKVFERLGGFADQPLMEDIELSRRLCKVSRAACLRLRVSTSARRWQRRGVWRTIWLMWRLRWSYWRGVPAARLAELYQ